jgi:Ca-activated chloride channel family protein
MDVPKKLPLIKAGLKLLLKNLRPVDTISLVTYGGMVRNLLEGISGNEKEKMAKAIDSLEVGGDTPGEEAIKLAYRIARRRLNKSSNNRIILASDGDFNVGSTSEKDLANLIESQSNAGIYLTCLGVGMGNYKDSKLSIMAHTGKGNFAYIDNELEAEKVMITEFTQTLYTVADGVYVTMKMDSAQVKEYRLIGYDNKRTDMADTANKVKGGELGSGQTSMALFEIVPKTPTGNPIARGKISYRLPRHEEQQEPIAFNCSGSPVSFRELPADLKKAACVTYFGLKLKQSDYLPKISWKKMEQFAETCFDKKVGVEKEFLSLIAKAKKIYYKKWLGIF